MDNRKTANDGEGPVKPPSEGDRGDEDRPPRQLGDIEHRNVTKGGHDGPDKNDAPPAQSAKKKKHPAHPSTAGPRSSEASLSSAKATQGSVPPSPTESTAGTQPTAKRDTGAGVAEPEAPARRDQREDQQKQDLLGLMGQK